MRKEEKNTVGTVEQKITIKLGFPRMQDISNAMPLM